MKRHGKQGTKGFTLIELLVVISIIALLMSIIVPTLGKAKEQARFVICRNQLKQTGLMIGMYAMENDDRIKGHPDKWMKALWPYYGYNGDNFPDFNVFCKEPLTCQTAIRKNKPKSDLYLMTYAINRFIPAQEIDNGKQVWFSGEDKTIWKITQPLRPSGTLLVADAGYFFKDNPDGTGRYFGCIDSMMWYTPGFYHYGKKWVDLDLGGKRDELFIDGSLNLLYFDLSVSLKKFENFPFDPEKVPREVFDVWNGDDANYNMFWYGRK